MNGDAWEVTMSDKSATVVPENRRPDGEMASHMLGRLRCTIDGVVQYRKGHEST